MNGVHKLVNGQLGRVEGEQLDDVARHLVDRFFFSWYGDPRDLHSFPTRRSSDLLFPPLGRCCPAEFLPGAIGPGWRPDGHKSGEFFPTGRCAPSATVTKSLL